jgi:2-methylcitrate dehydratase PrpD
METALAQDLACLALQLKDETTDVENRRLVNQCLIDAVAAALAGYDSSVATIALRFAMRGLGSGAATPWFVAAGGVTSMGAAFVNSSAMSSLDIDDGNRAARGHLGAAVIPAASAFGVMSDASPETFAHAILAGCEIGARLGAAESPPFFASGRWAGVGAAVAAGICLSFDESQLANAISLSVHTAPLMAAAGVRSSMTGHIKEGVPFGMLSGVTSALLAREGYKGDPDAVESSRLYDPVTLIGYPRTASAFSRTYFKRYTCCRLAHGPIDAAMAIVEREEIEVRDIERITVRTFRTAIELPNEIRPQSFESAQYSLPFAIAVAIRGGRDALLPLDASALHDSEIVALAARVVLEHDPDFDSLYPMTTPTLVRIRTHSGGAFEEFRKTADGDPGQPFTNRQLIGKLQTLGREKISEKRLTEIVDLVCEQIPGAREFENALR